MMRDCWYLWRQYDRPHGLLRIRYKEVSTSRSPRADIIERHMGAVTPVSVIDVDERHCYDDRAAAIRAVQDARVRQDSEMRWEMLLAIRDVQREQAKLREQFERLHNDIGMMGNDIARIDAHLAGQARGGGFFNHGEDNE